VHSADAGIETILDGLHSKDAQSSWQSFLITYSDSIYAVVTMFARDSDLAGDCFLFVCEKLADKEYRRLRAFRPNGKARFSTWLRAVVRNLCLDWHRARFGRRQVFRSVAALGAFEQQIFGLVFQRRLSPEEAWNDLARSFPGISYAQFEAECAKLRGLLTSRQLWLLTTANVKPESLDDDQKFGSLVDLTDPAPDPEALAVLHQSHIMLSRAVHKLDAGSQLLLRLRYAGGLGLQEIAKLVGLKDAQTVDRRIRRALEQVRDNLGIAENLVGKPKAASVYRE
jgi:RNA polymerase sigma factor (sigma-70 family)